MTMMKGRDIFDAIYIIAKEPTTGVTPCPSNEHVLRMAEVNVGHASFGCSHGYGEPF